MRSRRHTTIQPARSRAHEGADQYPKTLELEQRLSRLERCCDDLTGTVTTLKKRLAALQAELDHLSARTGRA